MQKTDFVPIQHSPEQAYRQKFCSRSAGSSWRAALQQQVINVDVRPLDESGFYSAIDMLDLGSITAESFDISAQIMSRSRRSLADGYDGLALSIAIDRKIHASQGRREFSIEPGQAILLDARFANELFTKQSTNFLGIRLSRPWFNRHGIDLPDQSCLVPSSTPLGLLTDYVIRLFKETGSPQAAVRSIYERHICELVAATLWPCGLNNSKLTQTAHDARYRCIREAVRTHASQPTFTLQRLSRSLGMSERTIQISLMNHGQKFSDLLRRERLLLAKLALNATSESISTIAFNAGFGDISTFNRAFRSFYGLNPREFRAKIR